MIEQLDFFTPLYFSENDTSLIQRLSSSLDHIFYLGGNVYTPLEGLTKGQKECVQYKPGEAPHFIIIAAKITIFFGAIVFIAVGIGKLATLDGVMTKRFMGVTTKLYHNNVAKFFDQSFSLIWENTPLRMSLLTVYTLFIAKVFCRGIYEDVYHPVNGKYDLKVARETLEKDVTLTPEMIQKVEAVWAKGKEQSRGATWMNRKVFKLEAYPEFIFKFAKDEQLFINMLVSQSICIGKQFEQLVMSHAKQFVTKSGYIFVAERVLPIDTSSGNQEHYYQKYGDRLEKAFEEVAEYVRESEESDYEWRNFPVYGLDPEKEPDGPLKLSLIDHDIREGGQRGILGYDRLHRRGLIRCLPEVQARKIAATLSYDATKVQEVLDRRLEEIECDREIAEFHRMKGVREVEKLGGPLPNNANLAEMQRVIRVINEAFEKVDVKKELNLKKMREVKITYTFNEFDFSNPWGTIQAALEALKTSKHIFDFSYELKNEKSSLGFLKAVGAVVTIQA